MARQRLTGRRLPRGLQGPGGGHQESAPREGDRHSTSSQAPASQYRGVSVSLDHVTCN